MNSKTFNIILKKTSMLSKNVKSLIFKIKDEKSTFSYKPGQFITIFFNYKNQIIKRSYSIANIPNEKKYIEIAVSYIKNGLATEILFNLKYNECLNIKGPFGKLILKTNNETFKRYIFLATNTGIAPYRSMIDELKTKLKHNKNLKIIILQGVKTRKDILFKNEFIDFSKKYPQTLFKACLSQEKNTLHNYEFLGYVQNALTNFNLNTKDDIIYLCGNPNMIDQSTTLLKKIGFESQQIIREKYISK
ncbi:FAD-binding oxidoreductase [Candidatus Legionella polyplacis]|uniref:FAD-binding oxidoreductase n=1 Tax=Candidatus Legionella polyplacis TaxID=2005262 RepID=A0ABZ2GWV4_9GAMM